MKLDTYVSYCAFSSEEAFKARDIKGEFNTRSEAKDCGGIVKACVSCMLENNIDGVAEFGYGDTVAEAKQDLKALLKRVYEGLYTI